jgi:hypothetical protein
MSDEDLTDFFEQWDASEEEFNRVLTRNPSIRGMVHGYLAEEKVKNMYFDDPDVTNIRSPDDHDRNKKADWIFDYRGERVYCEVKSLQSNHVERIDTEEGTKWKGKFQCDASDRRPVTLPNGEGLETTCLVVDEFDLLAVNLFEFGKEWRFAFAKNEDLPRTPYSGYDEEVRKHLLKGTMEIQLPFEEDSPFEKEPWELLEETVRGR